MHADGDLGHRLGPSYVAEPRGADHSDMARLTRRQVLAMLGAGGGLVAMGYAVRGIVGMAVSERGASDAPGMRMMDPRPDEHRATEHGHGPVYGDVWAT